jgi:hypothetical protein
LRHLLVIEEAHRLLKNISTEKTSEHLGNPKGKAIEHFSNMIAEMRAFGQGVLIAEQIPTKIAPDVIKNASNKIIHRIVARDDQLVIANMIGMTEEDAVFLGDQTTGRALCHIEGMRLPVSVAIPEVKERLNRRDSDLREKRLAQNEKRVLSSLVYPCLLNAEFGIGSEIIKVINAFFTCEPVSIKNAIESIKAMSENAIKRQEPSLSSMPETDDVVNDIIAEIIVKYLLSGIYQRYNLPENTLGIIRDVLEKPFTPQINALTSLFTIIDNNESLMVNAVLELAEKKVLDGQKQGKAFDCHKLIASFFYDVNGLLLNKIVVKLQKRFGGGL